MKKQMKCKFLAIFLILFAVLFCVGITQDKDSLASAAEDKLTTFNVPGTVLLGLYDWDGELLVYYMESGEHKLCLLDCNSGSIVSETKDSYSQTLAVSFCENNIYKDQNSNAYGVKESEEIQSVLPDEFFPETGCTSKKILVDDGIFSVSKKEEQLLRIYIFSENKFQWLDKSFNIVWEYQLEQQVSGQPLMDDNNKFIYYVNSEGDVVQKNIQLETEVVLETGGSFYTPPYLEGLYNKGTIAVISGNYMEVSKDGGNDNIRFKKIYIDTVNNSIISINEQFFSLTGNGDQYFISSQGLLNQAVFGSFIKPDEKWEFIFDHYEEYDNLFPWPESDRLLTFYTSYGIDGSRKEVCSLYSFETGEKADCISIPLSGRGGDVIRTDYACYIPESSTVFFHLSSQPGTIYCWNTLSDDVNETNKVSYKYSYIPADTVDDQGLQSMEPWIENMENCYGIEIYLGNQCPEQLEGYKAETTVSFPKARRALKFLEEALGKYPDGFFEQIALKNGEKLKFYLIRRLIPDGSDSLSSTIGLYGGSAGQYIALAVESLRELETLVYHEVSHAIDYTISGYGDQNYTDEQWSQLNPGDFFYAYSYRDNAADTSWDYIFNGTGDNEDAYFIDQYSKSFPTEDRARIMEKAMGVYPETPYFESSHLLDKLAYISDTIRTSFDSERWPDILWWERPLKDADNYE